MANELIAKAHPQAFVGTVDDWEKDVLRCWPSCKIFVVGARTYSAIVDTTVIGRWQAGSPQGSWIAKTPFQKLAVLKQERKK